MNRNRAASCGSGGVEHRTNMAIVTPYSHLHALVIDDQPAQQATLRGHLNLLGVGKVDGATNPDAALKQVRRTDYQLILCDYNLETRTDGQQLLEHLRESGAMPADCLFFMITAEAGYASVAATSEYSPDAYMLKPATASDIAERLKAGLDRRSAVLPVMQALKAQDLDRAVFECDEAVSRGGRFALHALQLKGQTLLQLSRPEDARRAYEDALKLRPGLVWARLGIARAEQAQGRHDEALVRARDIVESREGSRTMAAYDVIAGSLEARGDSRAALDTLRQAAEKVPSPKRHRELGQAAFRQGDLKLAHACLAKVVAATKFAITAQSNDILTMAQALIDLDQPGQAQKLLSERSHPDLQIPHNAAAGVANALEAQVFAAQGHKKEAREAAERARAALPDAGADFATLALARAEIATGDPEAGLARLQRAMAGDHENVRFMKMAGTALQLSGHADKIDTLTAAATQAMKQQIDSARQLLRNGDAASALASIEATLSRTPNNTAVLLEATQIACMSLRLNRRIDDTVVVRARSYLAKLEQLIPGSDRVNRMQRYLRDTLGALLTTPDVPSPGARVDPSGAAAGFNTSPIDPSGDFDLPGVPLNRAPSAQLA